MPAAALTVLAPVAALVVLAPDAAFSVLAPAAAPPPSFLLPRSPEQGRRAEQERAGVAAAALSREPTVGWRRGWMRTAVGVAIWG
jgi:hypothetical protein